MGAERRLWFGGLQPRRDTGTDADIEAFFACLGGSCCPICESADFNGMVTLGQMRISKASSASLRAARASSIAFRLTRYGSNARVGSACSAEEVRHLARRSCSAPEWPPLPELFGV